MMLKYWLLAIRPKTLTIAVIPVLVGSTLGWVDGGSMSWSVMWVALLAALFIQVGTNLHNDAADYERGADDSVTRLGPARVSAEGWLPSAAVRRGATVNFSLAMLAGIYLTWVGGWPILLVGLASIAAAAGYSGGPWPVSYSSLGELFVWLFFGLVAVAGSYYLQTGVLSGAAVIAGSLVGMPAAAVLVVNNYRDLDNDRRAGRNTLAVRWGRSASQLEYASLMLAPFALLPLLHLAGVGGIGWILPGLMLPWAILLVNRFRNETPGPEFNRLLAATAQFHLGLGLLLCLGLWTSR